MKHKLLLGIILTLLIFTACEKAEVQQTRYISIYNSSNSIKEHYKTPLEKFCELIPEDEQCKDDWLVWGGYDYSFIVKVNVSIGDQESIFNLISNKYRPAVWWELFNEMEMFEVTRGKVRYYYSYDSFDRLYGKDRDKCQKEKFLPKQFEIINTSSRQIITEIIPEYDGMDQGVYYTLDYSNCTPNEFMLVFCDVKSDCEMRLKYEWGQDK